jgi:hypothetical protein
MPGFLGYDCLAGKEPREGNQMDQCPICHGEGNGFNTFGQLRRCTSCKGKKVVVSAKAVIDGMLGAPISLGDAKILIATDVQARHGGATDEARTAYTEVMEDIRKGMRDLRNGFNYFLLDDTVIKFNAERRDIRHSR